jgi:hypothetical protein
MSNASVRLFPSYVAALKSYFTVRKKKNGRQSKPGDAARQAAARADEARRKAEAKEKEFTDKIDRLQVELRSVM